MGVADLTLFNTLTSALDNSTETLQSLEAQLATGNRKERQSRLR